MKRDPECLLVVDDIDDNRDLLSRRLMRRGYQVVTASGGQEALHLLAHARVDLVLLDIAMPGMSGYDVLTALRADPKTAAVPVIMVTAAQDNDSLVEALGKGANDYITKPINFVAAFARIEGQLSRRRAELALRESEERYALAVHGANDGLWDWQLTSDTVYFSPRWKGMLGLQPDEVVGRVDDWLSRVHPEDLEGLQAAIQAHRDGVTLQFEHEHRLLNANGRYRWMLSRGVAVRDAGRAVRMAGSLTDITARKEADPLTGLPNRALVLDRVARAMERRRRPGGCAFALLCLDLDRFKVVNETLGHAAGDQLLVEVARRLERELRSGDMALQRSYSSLARLGGAEFAVLVEDLQDRENALRIADRISGALEDAFVLHGRELVVTASTGLAFCESEGQSPEELLANAGMALSSAKKRGGNVRQVFDERMRSSALDRLRLEEDLRRAMDSDELVVHYQPIVDLTLGQVSGFEALIRWEHPLDGTLQPEQFLPVAEETGLIIPMSLWVLREACRQLARWRREFPALNLTMGVNVSAQHFGNSQLGDAILECLAACELPGESLHVEIVEKSILHCSPDVIGRVAELRAQGVSIELDDFGTGYSSLSYLHRFPFDALKIDRGFVSTLEASGENEEIIRSILMLGRDMNLRVVAEGIETPTQVARLRELGCRFGQGYLLGRPFDSAMAFAFLESAASGLPGGVLDGHDRGTRQQSADGSRTP
ncbi:MAG: EAL domain-containing protein [Acidobacteria bacterium]|nr:EAL domain-containing protein [Acidobacteriota bacterium]